LFAMDIYTLTMLKGLGDDECRRIKVI